ncbi:dihydroorotase, homodimeric type, variant [Puccinia striiformis f. sp. tritici PST-78]|uniref:Dihydroorotase, homodimeric type n=1 Tax=Puccinia striiformis f. sp. tritici PST-78 TaxID=1165861 RepID=A0A0L0V5S8_9BASI|nr:dihydroorotase, homodimeric type [Puccinia striiformis f. sp. tritici PST-78]KNE94618.1 dihydroorotase, homodimeric type, variant [Puccinia striiformis f. sp. tritici PST-78]
MTAIDSISLSCPFDAHVHLRQPGELLELVVTQITTGGIQSVYVMPNTVPPLTTVEMAVEYRNTLEALEPDVQFFVSLYLSSSLTPDDIRKAKACGIAGVKSYPRGVTTNSAEGVESYEVYYPVFEAMEQENLVLNLHGEVPSSETGDTCVWNAESKFLPKLHELHRRFPKLRIILEHATTKDAVEAVKACGPTVACTITLHHLSLTIDDWAGNGLNFCKPVAKSPDDREALRQIIREGHPRFFLGSDSAPHPLNRKLPQKASQCCAAGIYTSAYLLPTLAAIFESAIPPPISNNDSNQVMQRKIHSPIPLDLLPDFASTFGRKFYDLPPPTSPRRVTLVRDSSSFINLQFSYRYPLSITDTPIAQDPSISNKDIQLVPFWAGRNVGWKIQ